MSLIKFMNDIIDKNKLVFVFILGLLTCYLIFNYGSCKEGNASTEHLNASMFNVSVDTTDFDA